MSKQGIPAADDRMNFKQFIARLRLMRIHDEVKAHVEMTYGARLAELHSETCDSRMDHIAKARQYLWWLVKTRFNWSYPAIGCLTAHDHTTVMSGVKKYQKDHQEKTNGKGQEK